MWEAIISAFWVIGSLMAWVAIIGLFIWVIGWGIRFKFWNTQIGLIIWAFSACLLLLVLNNIFGSLGATSREWWEPAPNDFVWWYYTRFFINAAILGVIVAMLNILRKHWVEGTSIEVRIPAREPRETRPKTGPTPTAK